MTTSEERMAPLTSVPSLKKERCRTGRAWLVLGERDLEIFLVDLWLPRPTFREGNGNPLQNSCLENPMDRGAWLAAFYGVAQSRTRLSDFTFPFHFHALEKEMATHSSVLAWRIPGMVEPGGLPSMGSHRIGHDWSDLAAAAADPLLLLPLLSLGNSLWPL